jgi:hypothetical protein
MKRDRLLFLGGNGHCSARLDAARAALAAQEPPFDILDIACPGFEGRPPARGLEPFLDAVGDRVAESAEGAQPLLYATGIGGLVGLCLRARGHHLGIPLLLQAPVLWGLERRLMPRVLRRLPAERPLRALFRAATFQRRFARRHFRRAPDAIFLAAFFEGYARCAALLDLFAWMDATLLRRLEGELRGQGDRLAGVSVWWGGRDGVVTLEELRLAERALEVTWPLRVFPEWGHYPMIDAPGEWIGALAVELRGAVEDR